MLKQKFLVQFGSTISLRIFGMIAGIIVARIAGPEVVGYIAYATAFVSIFGFVTGFFGTGHIKLISEGRNLGSCVSTYTVLQLSSIVLYILLVLGWIFYSFYWNDSINFDEVQFTVIIIMLVATVMSKLLAFHETTFTAQLKQAKANYPVFIRGILFHAGRIVVVLLGLRAIGLVSWNLISTLLTLPFIIKLYKTLPTAKFDKALAKQYYAYAIPIFLIVVVNSVVTYSDKLILHHFTSAKELGYYSAAFALGGMILIVGRTIGTVFFPLFSSLIRENKWQEINNKITNFQQFIILFILPMVILLAFISKPLLLFVLGEKYMNSILPFAILLIASYINIVGLPYGNVITGMGKFYTNVLINVIKLVVYVISIYIFVSPDFFGLGAVGLAINLVVVNLINNLLFFLFAKKLGRIYLNGRNLFRYMLILFISFVTFFFQKYLGEKGGIWWIIFIPTYVIAIYTSLIMTGLLRKHHLVEYIQLLNLRKVLKYIKLELNE